MNFLQLLEKQRKCQENDYWYKKGYTKLNGRYIWS